MRSSFMLPAVVITVLSAAQVYAQAGGVAAELAAFLEEPGDESALSPAVHADPRAPYTLALAAMKSRKYDIALEHFNTATTRNRGDLASWRAKFWLLTYTKQREQALAQMKHIADIYPATAANEEIGKKLEFTAYWMGQLCGFLVGPADDTDADALVAQIEGALQGTFLTEFQRGKQEVAEKHAALVEEIAESRKGDEDSAETKEQEQEEFVSNERDRIASEREQIAQDVANNRAEIEKAISDLDSRLRPLELRMRDLNLLAEPIRQRIRDAQLLYSDALARSARVQDRTIQSALRGEADANLIILNRERDRLRPFEFEAARIQEEAARLQIQRNRLAAQFQVSVNEAGARQNELAKTEKKLDRAEGGPERTYTPLSTRTRGLQAKASAITTYVPFPLEVERLRILEALRR